MSGVRVKICGLTRLEDVAAAIAAGADAVGFVFAATSRRCIEPDHAAMLCAAVPPFVSRVGLFHDPQAEYVAAVLHRVPLSLLQFHGREAAGFCRQFDRPYLKALSASEPGGIRRAERDFPDACGLLVDSHEPGAPGGTGRTFDWDRLQPGRLPLVLAGGLTPDNVAEAIRRVKPWAVDVSTGVETAPGIKDAAAIERFIDEVRREQ